MDYVFFVIRDQKIDEAFKILKEALEIHGNAGRLWATLVFLSHI